MLRNCIHWTCSMSTGDLWRHRRLCQRKSSSYNLIYNFSIYYLIYNDSRFINYLIYNIKFEKTEFFGSRFMNIDYWPRKFYKCFREAKRKEDNVYSVPLLASTHWYLTIQLFPYDTLAPARRQPRSHNSPRTLPFFFYRFLDRRRWVLYSI